ncbi:aminotransferase class III-fold pyridoxal phosphate-dependent enzyme (plasmid) [Roseibium aggregatum]|uniref:aspartate aminotransferase family protein n=1 Tax=Roseibium aggregatum TaxID=187304 RepID=UPI001E47C36B|nr:aspartate aminotransferase family protein [Roseibium aggregatum]UES60120.1 aminotransferase class III-fold pyridoxal phosphate-dependent enzyme [Roseibium aggregatum]
MNYVALSAWPSGTQASDASGKRDGRKPFHRSMELTGRARAVYPAGVTRVSVGAVETGGENGPYSVYADLGEGAVVQDVDGNRYVDFHGNFSTLVHGHRHPGIAGAIHRQLERGTCFGNPTETDLDLAETIRDRIPAIERLRFLNSGTEAVMFAIKAARAATSRRKIAKLEGAFHGTYDWAEVSVRSTPANWGEDRPRSNPPYLGTPPSVCDDTIVLPFNDTERARKILQENGPDIACVLIDMLPCAAGMIPIEAGYLAMLQETAHKHGIVLISDEVVCFRLGYRGASATMGFDPDLVTLGKVVGGGLPIGVVGGRADLMNVFAPQDAAPVPQGGTFSANPLTMVAGRTALEALGEDEIRRIGELGDRLRLASEEIARRMGVPLSVQGAGSLFRFHAKANRPATFRETFADADHAAFLRSLHAAMLLRGIYVAAPFWGSVSTAMNEDHIDHFLATLRECLAELPAPGKS